MRDEAHACSAPTTYLTRQLETIDDRYVDVRQYDVGHTRLDPAYCLLSAVRDANIVAKKPQQLAQRIRARRRPCESSLQRASKGDHQCNDKCHRDQRPDRKQQRLDLLAPCIELVLQ